MAEQLPFDPLAVPDPNQVLHAINNTLSVDPFYGSTPVDVQLTQMNPKEYDNIMGLAWKTEQLYGREAAARFLIEKGIKPFPESK